LKKYGRKTTCYSSAPIIFASIKSGWRTNYKILGNQVDSGYKRDSSVGLLWVYPKTGPHGSESTNLDLTKKLVKNYSRVKKEGLLEKFEFS